MFGLKQDYIDRIKQCFAHYPQIEQVIIYGSRAKGNYRYNSDIDLTVIGDADFTLLVKLEKELDDLMMPYKIDLSLFHQIQNSDLIEHIREYGKILYQKP